MENNDSRRLLPLLGQYGRTEAEQWIFPSLRFTCPGRLTKWIFRAVSTQTTSSQCRINIGTWRLDRSISGTVYRRLSTTERLRRITRDGLIFTYELASPVQVQPDDIVGVELESDFSSCSITGGFSNILSLDLSRTGTISQSYRRFVIDSAFRVNYLVPFIQPVIGKIINNAYSID